MVKRFIAFSLISVSLGLAAQQPSPPEKSVPELKAELAEAQQMIAEQKQQIQDLQIGVQVCSSPDVIMKRAISLKSVQDAKDAATMARAAANPSKAVASATPPSTK